MIYSNVPEVRFAGFDGDWAEKKLGEILLSMKSGLSRMLANDDIGLPVVRANNINNGQLNLENEIKYWYKDDTQGANTDNYLIKKNDILVNFINSEPKMGTAAIVNANPKRRTIYTTNILNLRTNNDSNPYFIYCLTKLKSYKNYIKTITKPAVNQASFTTVDFKNFNFSYPSLQEQTKIGNFFKQLDDTIVLHQRELDNLKQTKKGFLQKMFPKDGETVPEIRFAGFDGDWEKRKLKDIADIYDGTHQTPMYQKYGIMFLSVENIDKLVSNKYISKESFESEFKIFPQKGDVLMTRIGNVGTTNVIRYTEAVAYYVSLALLKPKKIESDFLSTSISSLFVQKEIWKRTLHIAFPKKINKNEIEKVNIYIPSLQEQTQIGDFFHKLDNIIALKQRELQNLKQTKKVFLQKMFI